MIVSLFITKKKLPSSVPVKCWLRDEALNVKDEALILVRAITHLKAW
jgi:hypothetical protein